MPLLRCAIDVWDTKNLGLVRMGYMAIYHFGGSFSFSNSTVSYFDNLRDTSTEQYWYLYVLVSLPLAVIKQLDQRNSEIKILPEVTV